jgi:hypothetical protein
MAVCWGGGGIGRFALCPPASKAGKAELTSAQIMPWDSDIDVQVGEESMTFLANFYNMTVFHYKTPRIPQGRDYLLEINPHHVIRDESDKYNRIDARWIDTWSGLFIDITTVRKNLTHPSGPGILSCKDGHEYRVRPPSYAHSSSLLNLLKC